MPLLNLAIGQLRPQKGDLGHNLHRIGDLMAQAVAHDPPVQVLHLPETILSGYFIEGGTREMAINADELADALNTQFRSRVSGSRHLDLVVGFYEIWNNTLHNSAMYVTVGNSEPVSAHVHRKLFLPTYSLFDEERFVERGHEIRAFDTARGRSAMLVCEDAWHSMVPTIAALDGAVFIYLCAAAPSRGMWPRNDGTPGPYTLQRWERLVRDIAEEHGVFVSLAHLVGSEGGKIFAGGSVVVGPRGNVMARAPVHEEALLFTTLDSDDITRARADMPLLSDLRTMIPFLAAELVSPGAPSESKRASASPREPYLAGSQKLLGGSAAPQESAPQTTPEKPLSVNVVYASEHGATAVPSIEIDGAVTTGMLVAFIRDEFSRRGFSKALVGLSGGVDSAVTTYLASLALGAENVIAVRMPYRTSSAASLEHAQLVIDSLGVEGKTVDISAAVDGYLSTQPDADATRRGNVMARCRMITLFDLSAKYAALPLGTGNKTERLLGYFTWHADDSPPVNPVGDLLKTQLWELARHLGVPQQIIDKAPTADLVAGQTDEGDLGVSYATADHILNWLLSGYAVSEIQARGFSESEVSKVAQRLASTHWKRHLPAVAMLSGSAIGESYLRPLDY